MKKLITLVLFLSFLNAGQNYYDLSVGTTRYYDIYGAYGIAYTGDCYCIAIEKIIGDTLIGSTTYAKVNWRSEIFDIFEGITYLDEISYLRFENGILYQHTVNGDSILQNFNFAEGDSLRGYFPDYDDYFLSPPAIVQYETNINFSDGSEYKVLWGDDTLALNNFEPTKIPNIQTFIDSVLIDSEEGWRIPFGSTDEYFPYKPFYFIDSIGVVFSYWNYRNLPLVGIKTSSGRYYGDEFEIQTKIENKVQKLSTFHLSQNYPNPFNPTTTISYTLPKTTNVKISIYDLSGRWVETLVNNEIQPGTHQVIWNASRYSSGVYFYKIEAGDFVDFRKCLLVK